MWIVLVFRCVWMWECILSMFDLHFYMFAGADWFYFSILVVAAADVYFASMCHFIFSFPYPIANSKMWNEWQKDMCLLKRKRKKLESSKSILRKILNFSKSNSNNNNTNKWKCRQPTASVYWTAGHSFASQKHSEKPSAMNLVTYTMSLKIFYPSTLSEWPVRIRLRKYHTKLRQHHNVSCCCCRSLLDVCFVNVSFLLFFMPFTTSSAWNCMGVCGFQMVFGGNCKMWYVWVCELDLSLIWQTYIVQRATIYMYGKYFSIILQFEK